MRTIRIAILWILGAQFLAANSAMKNAVERGRFRVRVLPQKTPADRLRQEQLSLAVEGRRLRGARPGDVIPHEPGQLLVTLAAFAGPKIGVRKNHRSLDVTISEFNCGFQLKIPVLIVHEIIIVAAVEPEL